MRSAEALAASLCLTPVALAQPSEEPASDTHARAFVHVLVFERTRPLAGVVVRAAGAANAVRTGEDGAAHLPVAPGTVELRLSIPRGRLPQHLQAHTVHLEAITVGEGITAQVIVTLSSGGSVLSTDVEGAGPSAGGRIHERSSRSEEAGAKGTIRGRVVAEESREPVPGARVYVRGAPVETMTDADGRFSFELAEGEYGLAVLHTDYATESLQTLRVSAASVNEVKVSLTPASVTLEDYMVTAPHIEGGIASLLDQRRASSNVSDVIGAEEMSRSGDSDAAGALRRVTGITVVDGKFVYVRGMGERYSATLLNGQMIPSPEPERRVVPLDLFPTDVLESVVIQKTFSPDSPGEFGGGMVKLRTRSYPEKLTLSVSGSVGYNSQTTFQQAPTHRGGSRDWLGMDDGSRALPEEIRNASPVRAGDVFQEGYSEQDRADFARMLSNNWSVHSATVPVERGLSVSAGNTFEIGSVPIGVMASVFYDDDYQLTYKTNRRYGTSDAAEGGIEQTTSLDVQSFERNVSSGGIFVLGSEYAKGQQIKSTTLLLRITDMSTDLVSGVDSEDYDVRWSRLRFVERQLLTQQLTGQQTMGDFLQLDWRYAYSEARRDEPDRREYYYRNEASEGQPKDFQLSGRPDGNQRMWSQLDETIHDLGVDLTFRFEPFAELQSSAKIGGARMIRKRDVDTIRITFNGSLPSEVRRQSPDEVFSDRHIGGEEGWLLDDVTQGTDAYAAEQTIDAVYLMTELGLLKSLSVMAGLRVESSEQRVDTTDPFSDNEPVTAELDDVDWLPAATATWRWSEDMSVRGGYGRTVSRPDFRELSEASFLDVTKGIRYFGNPELERATIDNVDVRWEWYLSADELISLGAFYKQFDKPIEQVVAGGTDYSLTWGNARAATNYGVELEARSRLGFADESLDAFYAATNLAFIRSNVDLGDAAKASTEKSRPLQGQSPYVVNVQLGFDDGAEAGLGVQAALLYNLFGPRISEVGRFGLPDVYERPTHRVDVVYGQRLGYGLRLSLKVLNLLDPTISYEQADKVVQKYKKGRDLTLGLSWTY